MKETTKTPLRELKTVTIVFDDNTSHAEVLTQFVEKMDKFCKKPELIEHMKMVDVFIKDY